MRIRWRELFHYDGKISVEEQYSPFCIPQEILKAKFMQQYCEGEDRQGVLLREGKINKYLWLYKCHLRSDLKLLNELSYS